MGEKDQEMVELAKNDTDYRVFMIAKMSRMDTIVDRLVKDDEDQFDRIRKLELESVPRSTCDARHSGVSGLKPAAIMGVLISVIYVLVEAIKHLSQ